jgi:hypothetical protein
VVEVRYGYTECARFRHTAQSCAGARTGEPVTFDLVEVRA